MKKTPVLLALGAAVVGVVLIARGFFGNGGQSVARSSATTGKPSVRSAAGEAAVLAVPKAATAMPKQASRLGTQTTRSEALSSCLGTSVSSRVPRAKEALIALFSVKPGERPPDLPQLTFEERNLLPMVIENELTDADGCDAAAVRREFRLYMEMGGNHAEFLPAYRRKLMKKMKVQEDESNEGVR